MGRSYNVNYDESELMDELNELDEEIINEQLGDGLNVPSYIPKNQVAGGAQNQANKNELNEEDQLKNMMQI